MAKKKKYKFTGKEGKAMPEDLLRNWIQKHEDHHVVKGHFYGREILEKILGQPECMGIRIYYGINDKQEKVLVLVGADENGKDQWPSYSKPTGKKLKGGGGNTAADQGAPCPPFCNGIGSGGTGGS
jgi:hypothetical protein